MLLTAAGERLLAATTRSWESSTPPSARSESRPGPEGTIRLATECSTCYHWLPAVLKNLEEKYPGVDVQVVVEATREPIPALLDGRIDVGLVSDPVKTRASRSSRSSTTSSSRSSLPTIVCAGPPRSRPPTSPTKS